MKLTAPHLAFYGVILCWWIFGLTFWLRTHPPRARESKRDSASLFGLLLQAAAYFLVWAFPLRAGRFPSAHLSPALEWPLAIFAVALAAASAFLVNWSTRCLGKQWALAARLVEGHTLIQNGPYAFVRNPIYLGMYGMLLATGVAVGHWIPLLAATILFAAGTVLRIRMEERLLRQAFGSQFEAYASKVPALIPGIY